jgi:hypothetical protein
MTPDCWHVLEIVDDGGVFHKILCSNYGGYLHGDSWKMNSGIDYIKETDKAYEVYGFSGSKYTLYKNCERMSGIMSMIYGQLPEEFVRIIDMEKIKDWYLK